MRTEDIPTIVGNKARAAGAEAWLAGLPALAASLESEWGLTIGRGYAGATEAFVAEADLHDGSEAVLKLLVPQGRDLVRHEITTLQIADGEGSAKLLRSDAERGALLLERLGPSMNDLGVPLPRRQELLCEAAERLWRPAAGCGLPTGAEKAGWLIDFIAAKWEETGRPCSERAIDHALACAQRRIAAHDDERAVLVHGDVHQWNALSSGDAFKLVDPDGLLAEAEYDLGILMREDPVELLEGDPRARARHLAKLTGRDATAIWEWGVVERVSTGLICTRIDAQPSGRWMLAAADRVSEL